MLEKAAEKTRRTELAKFLRKKRESLSPAQVGLPVRPRTRTGGLRREDVAELAEISVSWYSWLEQAREINVSPQTLDSISKALRLNNDERKHLFTLAHQPLPRTEISNVQFLVSPSLKLVLESLDATPAFVMGRYLDVVAWNKAGETVFHDFLKQSGERKNWVRFVFAPENRDFFVDWENFAQCTTAVLRANYGRFAWDDTNYPKFIETLKNDFSEFDYWWENYNVLETPCRRKEFQHKSLGLLSFNAATLYDQATGQQIVIYSLITNKGEEQRIESLFKIA
jgi:transcriptional regulator with XRE-family HTH domain